MKRRTLLLLYQLVTGISDAATGILLIFAPEVTLRLMRVSVAAEALPFLSYIGVFVLSVGCACLVGAGFLGSSPVVHDRSLLKLEVVWLLTAITRGLVATFVAWKIASGVLEPAWASVAIADGLFAGLQVAGLARGWLANATD